MIERSTDVRAALRSRQRGFLLNPFRFGGGSAGLEFVGGTTTGTSGGVTSYTVNLSGTLTGGTDSSPAAGDIVIVASGYGYATSVARSTPTCTGNNGGAYTAAHTGLWASDSWDTFYATLYKIQGSTPDTQLTITKDSTASYAGNTAVHVWRGVDTSTPLDVAPVTATGTNGSRLNAPAITPITSGAVILAMGGGPLWNATGAIPAFPSGMSNGIGSNVNGTTCDFYMMVASYEWSAGSYDPAAVTGGGGADDANGSWAGCTLALRPA